MPLEQILQALHAERERISKAIEALEEPKRRGRPPKAVVSINSSRRPPRTPGQRKAQSER